MKKYLIIILFLSSIFAQNFSVRNNQIINRNISIDRSVLINDHNSRDEEELIQFIEDVIQTHLIPGLSVSIVKDGTIVWEEYFGHANIEDNILVVIYFRLYYRHFSYRKKIHFNQLNFNF